MKGMKGDYKMKAILVNPRAVDDRKNTLPLGLLYILGHLRTHGFDVKLFDFYNLSQSPEELFETVCQNEVAMVGFSVCSGAFYDVVRMAAQIKMLAPRVITVLGGPHASVDYKSILLHHPQIDLVSIGAGEETILQIMEHISNSSGCYEWSNVNNIAYRSDDKNVAVSEWVERDISQIGAPCFSDYEGIYNGVPSICTVRGCAFSCNFCALNVEPRIRWKCRSEQRISEELNLLGRSFSLKVLDITDADFFTSPVHAERVINVLSTFNEIEDIYISCRIDSLLRCWYLFERMIERFVVHIELGIEAYSREQLNRYNKKITPSHIDEAIKKLKKCNPRRVKLQFDFILFDPYTTKNDLRAALMFIQDNKFNCAKNEDMLFSKMHLLPNTKLREMAVSDGLTSLNDVYLPYWRFKNEEVALLYSYVLRYKTYILPQLKKSRRAIEECIQIISKNQIDILRLKKMLSTFSFSFFSDLLQCNSHRELEEVYSKYHKMISEGTMAAEEIRNFFKRINKDA